VSQPPVTASVTGTVSQPPEVVSTVPSQAGLLRSIGQRLGVGMNKIPECKLDARLLSQYMRMKRVVRMMSDIETLARADDDIRLNVISCGRQRGHGRDECVAQI